jgi:hypothetical protein
MLEIKFASTRADLPQRYRDSHRRGWRLVVPPARVTFPWILNSRRDLLYYIGSALAGWFYVGIIFYAIHTLKDPLRGAITTLNVAGFRIPLTLQLLVVTSWAFILDAPHVWATLARTLFDPDEWKVRRKEIQISFLWFIIGPAAILLPYVIGSVTSYFGLNLPMTVPAMGAVVFFVFFRFWAYYHVVRQHWGFFNLYKRKANDYGKTINTLDYWFFNLSLYMPLVLFLSSSFYQQTPGFPNLGLQQPLIKQWSVATVAYPLGWIGYLGIVLAYIGYHLKLWKSGASLNGSKLLYMSLIVPLHFVAFSHPLIGMFAVPIVTVGHNIQYHCIVYSFAQNKYRLKTERGFRFARGLFKNFAVYSLIGLLFTLALYRGPWIEWLKHFAGLRLDQTLLNSLAMMAGVKDPSTLSLGEKSFAAFIAGFAMQHYYLDSKIWRVNRDKNVQKYLRV